MKLGKLLRCLTCMLLILQVGALRAERIVNVPIGCSVDELEYLMASQGLIDSEYCFDFSNSGHDDLVYLLSDKVFASETHDYINGGVHRLDNRTYNNYKNQICGTSSSTPVELNQFAEGEVEALGAIASDITNGARGNSHLNQVLRLPGILNELSYVIATDKRDYEGFAFSPALNGLEWQTRDIPRVTKDTEGLRNPVMEVEGFIDGQFNNNRHLISYIYQYLCEKDSDGQTCKIENGKVKIDVSESKLKEVLKGAKVGLQTEELDEFMQQLQSRKVRDIDCSRVANGHSVCNMIQRLRSEGIEINSLAFDTIPSVCSGMIPSSERAKSELVPSMLNNYFFAKVRTESLASFLSSNLSTNRTFTASERQSSAQAINAGPDFYKVMKWNTTPQIADYNGAGHGVCERRRGAKVSIELGFVEGREGLQASKNGNFNVLFGSPARFAQDRLQESAVYDVFKRLGAEFNKQGSGNNTTNLFKALYESTHPTSSTIGKINYKELEAKLREFDYAGLRVLNTDGDATDAQRYVPATPEQVVRRVLDDINNTIEMMLPYACRSADYSSDENVSIIPNDGTFDLHITAAKKIIFDMMAGFRSKNKSFEQFKQITQSDFVNFLTTIPDGLESSVKVGFTDRYGEKIIYRDIEDREDAQVWGDGTLQTSAYDFYMSSNISPGFMVAELRGQNAGGRSRGRRGRSKGAEYNRHLRRYTTPHITITNNKVIEFKDQYSTGVRGVGSIQHSQYSTNFALFQYNGNGTLTLSQDAPLQNTLKDGKFYGVSPVVGSSVTICNEAGIQYVLGQKTANEDQYKVFGFNAEGASIRGLTQLTNEMVLKEMPVNGTGIENITRSDDNNFTVADEVASLLGRYSCTRPDGESSPVVGKIFPLYSPFFHHSGRVTPTSVFSCFSTLEAYSSIYRYGKDITKEQNTLSISDNESQRAYYKQIINNTHFAFNNYKNLARKEESSNGGVKWKLKLRYNNFDIRRIKYRGYNENDTFDSVDGREKEGFLNTGWGSGVPFEENPGNKLQPGFKYYEEKKDDLAFEDRWKYAVQFKKAYENYKAKQSSPRFEYIPRFREKDRSFSRIDSRNGESGSQVYYVDALNKYYQLRAYMEEDYNFSTRENRREVPRLDNDLLLFGETKSPHVIMLKNCSDCFCANNPSTLAAAIKEGTFYNFYDGYNESNEKEYNIELTEEEANNTCIFSPFVPHTASFPNERGQYTNDDVENEINVHVGCGLTQYLQDRLMKVGSAESRKIDESKVYQIIQACRKRRWYFPTRSSMFSSPNSNTQARCNFPEESVNEN